jgi:hypothetical protein
MKQSNSWETNSRLGSHVQTEASLVFITAYP